MLFFAEGVIAIVVSDQRVIHGFTGRRCAARRSVTIEADEWIGACVSGATSEEAYTVVTDFSGITLAWCTGAGHADFLVAEAVHIGAVFGAVAGWEACAIEAGFTFRAWDTIAFAIDEVDASVLPAALACGAFAIGGTIIKTHAAKAGFLTALRDCAEVGIVRSAKVAIPAGIRGGAVCQ